MTEWLREWLLAIVGASLLLSIGEALAPAGPVKKVLKLTGGLVLALVLLRPLGGLAGWEQWLSGAESQAAFAPEGAETFGDAWTAALVREETEAYLASAAKELGLTCEFSVECREENGLPVPCIVTVTGTVDPEGRAALSARIQADLGIGPEGQIYQEGDST